MCLSPHCEVFGSGTDLHDHPFVTNGQAILQDKASCFPAHVLNPAKDSHVIDACAAPGNKTSHAAARMGGGGQVYAFEVNPRRCKLLKARMKVSGAQNVSPMIQDFLEVSALP